QDIELATAGHDMLEIIARRDGGRWIVRIVEIQHARAVQRLARNLAQVDEEIGARTQCVAIRLSAREQRAPLVRVVAWARNDRDAPRLEIREGEMRNAFLGADERNDLGEWIEADAEPLRHPRRNGLTICNESEAKAIATHGRLLRRVDERLDRLRRR